jgi:hypothetical protein
MIWSNGDYYIGLYFLISRILPQSTMVILKILRCCRMPWVNWAQMWTLSAPDWRQEVDGLENPTTEELVCVIGKQGIRGIRMGDLGHIWPVILEDATHLGCLDQWVWSTVTRCCSRVWWKRSIRVCAIWYQSKDISSCWNHQANE